MIRSPIVQQIDEYGDVVLNEDSIIDAILNGVDINGVKISDHDALHKYESVSKRLDRGDRLHLSVESNKAVSPSRYLQKKALKWKIPSEYMYMDMVEFLINSCSTNIERERVAEEIVEFNKHNELFILNVMKYIVDQFRKHDVVWGIGRGSSVSCLCFYLIGINKINPLDYGIPYTEYFKNEE